jgi:hypothetical protein
MFVVVTAPHGYCPTPCSQQRQCDCVAALWASKLNKKLQEAGVASTLLIPLTPRSEGDFNRIWTRDSPYRQQLTKAMETAWLVLDIHSYPPPHWEGYNAIVLDDRRSPPASLLDFSIVTKITIDVRGQGNDIQDEAHSRGIEAFLIEFNEQGDVVKQTQMVENIVAWVKHQKSNVY